MTFEVRIEQMRTTPVPSRLKTTPPSSSQYSTSSSESPIATPTFTVSFQYDGSSSEDGVVPKIEELNDSTDDGKTSLGDEGETSNNSIEQRRPRGRPKKPQVEPPDNAKTQKKGRTKTGCITCRQRKKKCDETKPVCTSHPSNLIFYLYIADSIQACIARITIITVNICQRSIIEVGGRELSRVRARYESKAKPA